MKFTINLVMSYQFWEGPSQAMTPHTDHELTKGRTVMFKSLSTSLIARGVVALVIGVLALAWPGVTVLALVVMFAVYAFIAAGLEARLRRSAVAAQGRSWATCYSGWSISPSACSPSFGPGLRLWSSCCSSAAGPSSLARSRSSSHSDAAKRRGRAPCSSWADLVSVAFGAVLFARPGVGAVTLALLFGLFNLIAGCMDARARRRVASDQAHGCTPWSPRPRSRVPPKQMCSTQAEVPRRAPTRRPPWSVVKKRGLL